MPEYEVNLESYSGENRRQYRLPAASPELALQSAQDMTGGGYALVSVHEVTLTPVLVPTGPGGAPVRVGTTPDTSGSNSPDSGATSPETGDPVAGPPATE